MNDTKVFGDYTVCVFSVALMLDNWAHDLGNRSCAGLQKSHEYLVMTTFLPEADGHYDAESHV